MQPVTYSELRWVGVNNPVPLTPNKLADILEVIRALSTVLHGMTMSGVERIRAQKEEDRGGFKEGLVLEKVLDNE